MKNIIFLSFILFLITGCDSPENENAVQEQSLPPVSDFNFINNPKDFLSTVKASDVYRSNPRYSDEYRFTHAIDEEIGKLLPSLIIEGNTTLATDNPYVTISMYFVPNLNQDNMVTLENEIFLLVNSLKKRFPKIEFGNISIYFSTPNTDHEYAIDLTIDYEKAINAKKGDILKVAVFSDPNWTGSTINKDYYAFCARFDQLNRKTPQLEFCHPFME
ncbi:hypothetical protein [Acinetobacter venetianus]|uniref:hypothetical protein n=1 Tax=Acinetobacter venetianus TaxID=52133 RepID=UPI0007786CE7|nr:hypothetical protein [Acinetobacter venetianus]KXZ64975.1 hypothetical protein AVENLUH7437_01707 [Acinetobacter venetianus]